MQIPRPWCKLAGPKSLGWLWLSDNASHSNSVFRVSYGDGTMAVRMDDGIYLVTPDTLINQTIMSRLAVEVGDVVLVITKNDHD